MNAAKRRDMAARAEGRWTVPQIFIAGAGIGGCEELSVLIHEGKLDRMLGLVEG